LAIKPRLPGIKLFRNAQTRNNTILVYSWAVLCTRFKDYLKNYLSFQSIKSYTYFARRLNTKKKAKVDIKEESPPISIKESDWKLIKLLQLDSRTGAVELSKKLKISVNTIMRRLKFLKKKGII
jgi:predicted HTH transcriptional regulator